MPGIAHSLAGRQMLRATTVHKASVHEAELNGQHQRVNVSLEDQEGKKKTQFLISLRSNYCLRCWKFSSRAQGVIFSLLQGLTKVLI